MTHCFQNFDFPDVTNGQCWTPLPPPLIWQISHLFFYPFLNNIQNHYFQSQFISKYQHVSIIAECQEVMCQSSYEGKNMNQKHFSDITQTKDAASKKLNSEVECLTNWEEQVRGRGTAEACCSSARGRQDRRSREQPGGGGHRRPGSPWGDRRTHRARALPGGGGHGPGVQPGDREAHRSRERPRGGGHHRAGA